MVKRLLLASTALLVASAAHAQLQVTSQVGAQRMGVDDQIQLTVTVTGGDGEIPLPALDNLVVVGGPSESSQISLNGTRFSQSRSRTWVLQPKAPGRAEVGAVHVKSGSEEKIAPAIPIEVVPGSVRQQQQAPPPDPFDPFGGADPFEPFGRRRRMRQPQQGPPGKLFLEAAPSRTRVHVGEPFLLTYYLYTQITVRDGSFADPPKYAGFWSEDLPKPEQRPEGEVVAVDGENYHRIILMQKLLFPTRPGTLTIPPVTLRFGLGPQSFFDQGGGVVARSTKPVQIEAEPIPGEPGFAGAVGRFTVSASLDKASVAIGDAATLRFEVKGSGNLKWVDAAPTVQVPGAKVYPPQVKSALQATPTGITGSKTWEFVVVPETAGVLEVPAIPFTYFDSTAERLTTATTTALPLQVEGGALGAGASFAPSSPAAAARSGGPLALRSDLDPPHRFLPALTSRMLLLFIASIAALHASLFTLSWWMARSRTATGRPARGGDVRRALSDLRKAGRDGMTKEASVALIERTLHDVFGPLDDTSGGPETPREKAARDVLQDVYFIRYAPQLGDYSEKIQEVAQRATEVVQKWA